MASIRKERGVLKLVHPGRHVEVHREPIRAADVMRRNPRHCITRPDVFDFPWIVVKPEAVLVPGSVFLIVPNHKIYDLLKAKGQCNNLSPFSQQNQSPNIHVHQDLKQDSPVTSFAGMSPKNPKQKHNKPLLPLSSSISSLIQKSLNFLCNTMFLDRENVCNYDWDKKSQNIGEHPSCDNILDVSLTARHASKTENVCNYDWDKKSQNMGEHPSRNNVPNVSLTTTHVSKTKNVCNCDWDKKSQNMRMGEHSSRDNVLDVSLITMHVSKTGKRSQNQSHVEQWPKLNSYDDKIEQELPEESSFESIPYEARQYYQNNKKAMETESPKKDVNLEFVPNYEQFTMLKSCLRRPYCIRKSLNPKVSFNIPIKKEEQ